MDQANNEVAADKPIGVALIAGGEDARRLAAAVRAQPELRLVAQAGMPEADALPDLPWHDDQRVMIVQGGMDALLVGAAPRAARDLGDTAVAHNVHVWRAAPIGRTFAEAIEAVRRLRVEPRRHRIASWWDHVGEQVRWGLEQIEGFQPLLSELRVSAAGPATRSWKASLVDAAGGVLADDGYGLLEALVAVRGLPESVTAAVGRCRRRSGEPPRETEDVATAILRYEGGGIAVVRALWDLPPPERVVLHHGAEATVAWDDHHVCVRNAGGEVTAQRAISGDFLTAEMARFAEFIRGSQVDERTVE